MSISTLDLCPDGTGVLVLSNDDGDFHHNIIQGNGSFGLVLLDQLTLNVLSGTNFFNPLSHSCAAPDPVIKCAVATQAVDCPLSGTCVQEQKSTGNQVHSNLIDNSNGANQDNTPPNSTQMAGNPLVYEVSEQDPAPNCNFNCFEGNGIALAGSLLGAVALTTCP
jgi:hypothetical protein